MANFGLPTTATGTDQELLDLVRATIANVLAHGQDRMHNGRRVTLADLAELRRMEADLTASIAAASYVGPAVNYVARLRAH